MIIGAAAQAKRGWARGPGAGHFLECQGLGTARRRARRRTAMMALARRGPRDQQADGGQERTVSARWRRMSAPRRVRARR
jgi:hypothetical protein